MMYKNCANVMEPLRMVFKIFYYNPFNLKQGTTFRATSESVSSDNFPSPINKPGAKPPIKKIFFVLAFVKQIAASNGLCFYRAC